MANSAAATLDAIAGCRDRIDQMCASLDQARWHQPTALAAWDVQDVVAHLGSLEAMLLGWEEPAHEPATTAHVRNPLGALNERLVDRRRSWSGAQVLDEFRDTTARRLADLRALDEVALDREVLAPSGRMVPLRDFLGIRVWDYFVHEMDITDALGLAPPLATKAATRVLDEMLLLLPRAAAKAGAPDGTLVRLDLTEPMPRSVAAGVDGGRGASVDPSAAGEAALHLRASPAAFLRVCTGRRAGGDAIDAGEIEVGGDSELAARVLARLNVVP